MHTYLTVSLLALSALAGYVLFYRQFRDLLHPVGLLLLTWYGIAALAATHVGLEQHQWSVEMFLTVWLSGIAVAGGATVARVLHQRHREALAVAPNRNSVAAMNSNFHKLALAVFCVAFVCALAEWVYSGFAVPGLGIGTQGADSKAGIKVIPGIHYGTILLPYCAVFAFADLLRPRRHLVIATNIAIIAISIVGYSYLLTMSRGSILISLLGMIYVYHRHRPIRVLFLAGSAALMAIGFVAAAYARIHPATLTFNILPWDHPLAGPSSAFYSYSTYGFSNLQQVVASGEPLGILANTFGVLLQPFGLAAGQGGDDYTTLIFNQTTYLHPYVQDLGLFGALLYPFIIGLALAYFYLKSLAGASWVILLAVMQKGILATFFGNYLTSELIILWPYLVTALMILVAHRMRPRRTTDQAPRAVTDADPPTERDEQRSSR